MPPLDPATLPDDVTALRSLLLAREDVHAAELAAAHNGLKEQVLRNEQLKLRLTRLLRERFGASSEKLRRAIEQLELMLGTSRSRLQRRHPPNASRLLSPRTAMHRCASLLAGRCPRRCRARL